jgi:hypothetical protein
MHSQPPWPLNLTLPGFHHHFSLRCVASKKHYTMPINLHKGKNQKPKTPHRIGLRGGWVSRWIFSRAAAACCELRRGLAAEKRRLIKI